MAVFLSIIKWIGIILGCLVLGILALALLILLVVLFVPFRYQATVATDETGKKKVLYGFGVTWILHAISVRKQVDSDQVVIRILGIPVKRIGGEETAADADVEWEESFPEETAEEDDEKIAETSDEPPDEAVEDETENRIDETLIEESEDVSEDEDENEKQQGIKRETEVESIESGKKSEEKIPFPMRLVRKVEDRIRAIKKKIRHTFKKISFIFYKISSIIDFVKDRAMRRTIKMLMKEAVKAIRYVGPKKISGTLEFGTGDPGSTGLILAGISLCSLSYKKDVTITPNFEEKCLSGDCTVKGRIRVVYFVRMALRIWFNKDVHHLWKSYRQMKKSFRRESKSRGLDAAA